MSFNSDEPVDLKGVAVGPRDVLMKLVKRPVNRFLEADEESILQSDLTGILVVSVERERAGNRYTHDIAHQFTDGPNHELQRQLFKAYGTTMVYLALPAVVGARMCVSGEVAPGLLSPDSLDPQAFFARMADRGVPFNFEEQISGLADTPQQ